MSHEPGSLPISRLRKGDKASQPGLHLRALCVLCGKKINDVLQPQHEFCQ